MTNGDKIRPMSDEKMALWLAHKRRALRRWWKLLNFIGRENNEY